MASAYDNYSAWGGGGGYSSPYGQPPQYSGAPKQTFAQQTYQQSFAQPPPTQAYGYNQPASPRGAAVPTYGSGQQPQQQVPAYQGYQVPAQQQQGYPSPQLPFWPPQTYAQYQAQPSGQLVAQLPGNPGQAFIPPWMQAQMGAAAVPTYNTNGYQQLAAPVTQYAQYAMPGWEQSKWADPTYMSPKYAVGRLLSNLAPRTANMAQAVALINQIYPGTQLIGDDKISIPGVGVTDILQSAGSGGKAWQWISPNAPSSRAPDTTMQQDPTLAALMQFAQMPQIAALMGGGGAPAPAAPAPAPAAPTVDAGQLRALQSQVSQLLTALQAAKAPKGPQFTYY